MRQNYCKDCHWHNKETPFEILSNGKFYPCHNIGVDGWEYWHEHQTEPEDCDGYCKQGEYVPTDVWAGVAKVASEVGKVLEQRLLELPSADE